MAQPAVGGSYPYSGPVSLALAALTGLAGLWGRSQASKRKTAEATATEIVKSIDKAVVNGIVNLSDVKQDRETEKVVREIQAA